MLYLCDNERAQNPSEWKLWHVGEPVPKLNTSGIVYIQASEVELQMILTAMRGEN